MKSKKGRASGNAGSAYFLGDHSTLLQVVVDEAEW
jgi:hypothetical protein